MDKVSMIIPTHNRHNYLDRILEYYQSVSFKVYIADSTDEPYQNALPGLNFTYLHLPDKSLTQKISYTLNLITTPFVVMCADDDFSVPESISKCVDFLIKNNDHSSVIGNCIAYMKNSIRNDNIQFAALYDDRLSYSILQDEPFERVDKFFNSYRSLFYAVHRLKILQEAFNNSGSVVSNLYLNEYLIVIMILIKGKVTELPMLLQVREYTAVSGDKITANLDAVFFDESYLKEYNDFLDFVSSVISKSTGKEQSICREKLDEILRKYAVQLRSWKNTNPRDLTKRVGSLIRLLPFIGPNIILRFRAYKEKKKLTLFIRSEADRLTVATIENLIRKYKNAI